MSSTRKQEHPQSPLPAPELCTLSREEGKEEEGEDGESLLATMQAKKGQHNLAADAEAKKSQAAERPLTLWNLSSTSVPPPRGP